MQVKTRILNKIKKQIEEINFEFTSPGTPNKNGLIEWVFATLYSWMHVMMAHAGQHENLNTGPWKKCATTATKLEDIITNPHKEEFTHKYFYGNIPYYAKHFKTLVEISVVHSIITVKSKLEDRFMKCMFLVYAQNHNGSTYTMLNIRTKYIVLSRDIIWLDETYGE